jgi:hypothetical protein
MVQMHFPDALARSVAAAAKKGVETLSGVTIRPLAIFSYSDGPHTMLSSTWIILPAPDAEKFVRDRSIASWPFLAQSWDRVTRINVPDLSTKERMQIDRMLLSNADQEIAASLSFLIGSDSADSVEQISQYRRHYRHYPNFARVAL